MAVVNYEFILPWAKNESFAENIFIGESAGRRKTKLLSHMKLNRILVAQTQREIDHFHPGETTVLLVAYKNLRIKMIDGYKRELKFTNATIDIMAREVVVKRKCVGADALDRKSPLPFEMVQEVIKYL